MSFLERRLYRYLVADAPAPFHLGFPLYQNLVLADSSEHQKELLRLQLGERLVDEISGYL